MKLLLIINFVLLLLNSFCAMYLWVLAFFGIRVRQRQQFSSQKYNRLAILIPAHNEEENIDVVLNSIKELDYPKELYDCYFGADHCTDKTIEKIKRQGYICYEKNDGFKGKGRILLWLTKKILNNEKGYDAVCYFDADTYIDSNFLKVMNDGLNAGNEIMQGYVGILNWDSSMFSIANYLNFATINRLKQNARTNAGLSTHLHGLGMCFKVEVLKEFEWPADSVTEDQKFLIDLIMGDKKIVWEHRARVYSKMSSSISTSKKQRLRWSVGKNKLFREKALSLLMKMRNKFDLTTLDTFIEFLMPPNSFLIGLSLFSLIIATLFLRNHHFIFLWSFALVGAYFFYFLLGALLERIPLSILFKCFLTSPFFIFWRMWIYLLSLRKAKVQEWR